MSLEFESIPVDIHQKTLDFLRTDVFSREFRAMLKRAVVFEQGLEVVWSLGERRVKIAPMLDVATHAVGNTRLKVGEAPILKLHVHPVGDLGGIYAVPSESDLGGVSSDEEEYGMEGVYTANVAGIVVAGRRPVLWLWEVPTTNRVGKIGDEWRKEIADVNNPTYNEIGDLEEELKEAGLRLIRTELDPDQLPRSFVAAVKSSGFQLEPRKI